MAVDIAGVTRFSTAGLSVVADRLRTRESVVQQAEGLLPFQRDVLKREPSLMGRNGRVDEGRGEEVMKLG